MNMNMNRFQLVCKRLFDIIVSAIGLTVLSPAIFLVILALQFSSRGPIFFFQQRVGREGRLFNVVKFRTMIVGGEQNGSITTASDDRITSVGRWIRRFNLDEYPQLWNVLVGNMSLVGSRPDVLGYADQLVGRARSILSLRPGITGLATLYFIHEEEILDRVAEAKIYNDQVIYPAKVALNLMYLEKWSFSRDIGYIMITMIPSLNNYLKLIPNIDVDTLARQGINACREQ